MSDIRINFLNAIVTRIDYEDQIKIVDDILLKVKNICNGCGIEKIGNRMLELERDFSTNDSVSFRDLSEEYVKTVLCKCYYNEEFAIEINPLFLRIIQQSTEEYDSYQKSHLPIVKDIFCTLNVPLEQIIRISVKKVDEVYYETLETMEKYFKSDILQNKVFGKKQNWDVPQAESKMIQNFEYDNFRVNFCRGIDRGMVREKFASDQYRDKILYRLLLDYEVYSRENIGGLQETLCNIDQVTEELFLEIFTEEGKQRLYQEEGGFENYVLCK